MPTDLNLNVKMAMIQNDIDEIGAVELAQIIIAKYNRPDAGQVECRAMLDDLAAHGFLIEAPPDVLRELERK